MLNVTPLNQPESLSKMAYNAIRRSILSGDIKIDEIYYEVHIAKNLGISRTPVREALLELSSQGLISLLPRKGFIVKTFSRKDIEEIFEIRSAIELATVEKISQTSSLLEFNTLDDILTSQCRAAADKAHSKFVKLDRSFHVALGKLTNNSRIEIIMQNIRDFMHLMGLHAVELRGRMDAVVNEHKMLLHAVRQGMIMESRVLMNYHLQQSRNAVLQTYVTPSSHSKA
ncbi:DNA-binding transcriptional regulator, GntR family [Desulfocicer vacuolatum DSM 3385]|uniref:DNA-binding transcriptional regulator, GntR family n=1 Tax=Desulfocicer vacuolatum DSM 3385 TaxID=1121400 RepID=A0A1W2AXQ7_9BACT|nr:GntR family transcriptional regulator [Desulfocicer vacuolatum]SMC65476.1 DNA-binding transcriptional regulator, GntR family [Desulfocicer vacuolatum DSM 3385]